MRCDVGIHWFIMQEFSLYTLLHLSKLLCLVKKNIIKSPILCIGIVYARKTSPIQPSARLSIYQIVDYFFSKHIESCLISHPYEG